jgi:hypothetical protein
MKESRKRIGTAGWMAAAILTACQAAGAATIIVTATDPSRGDSHLWINANGNDMQVYAGVLFIRYDDGTQSYNGDALCVDLFVDIGIGGTYGSGIALPDEVPGRNLDRVSWLVDNALLPPQSGSGYQSALPPADWVTDPSQGAGLQLAIWDIVHDGGDGFDSGLVQDGSSAHPTDPQVLAWARSYEAVSVGQASNDSFVFQNVSLNNGQEAQTLMGPALYSLFQPPPSGPDPVPECGTFLLAGSALVGIGLIRRQRHSR